jgi:ABC-type lipoprotein export system ATPase subunit
VDIGLHQLMPVPMRDTLGNKPSDIWKKDLRCHKGECIHICAPSGTGKTTLIHFLFRLRGDYEGRILMDDRDMRSFSSPELARVRQKNLSIVFQDLRLFSHISGRENLEVKRLLTATDPDGRIPAFAQRLGIGEKLDQPLHQLSYGEQQRVAIARSLLQPFDWILLDEPFSHLDRNNISVAAGLIAEICQEKGAGMIVVDLEDDNHFNYSKKLML